MATGKLPTTNEALQYAVERIRGRDVAHGREALSWVLKREPDNVAAWLWMEKCVSDPALKGECLRRASSLNPFQSA